MPPAASSGSAVFLVRVWLDGDLLRARITETLDLTDRHDDETVTLTDSTDEVKRRLHSWLDAFSGTGQ